MALSHEHSARRAPTHCCAVSASVVCICLCDSLNLCTRCPRAANSRGGSGVGVFWDIKLDKGSALPVNDEIEICPMTRTKTLRRCCCGPDACRCGFSEGGEWFGGFTTHRLHVPVIVITCNPRSQSPRVDDGSFGGGTRLTCCPALPFPAPAPCPSFSPLLLVSSLKRVGKMNASLATPGHSVTDAGGCKKTA